MSVSTWIRARKKLTEHDRALVTAFNALFESGIAPSSELILKCEKALGKEATENALDDEHFSIKDDVLEISLYGKWAGDVECGDGAILKLSDLPPGTFALRIYME